MPIFQVKLLSVVQFFSPIKTQVINTSFSCSYSTSTHSRYTRVLIMPTAAGLLLSSVFGASARLLQTAMSGSPSKLSSKIIGYSTFMGFSTAIYLLVIDPTIQNTNLLFERRLTLLREQREKRAEFYDFEPATKQHPYKRGAFTQLLDKFGAKY